MIHMHRGKGAKDRFVPLRLFLRRHQTIGYGALFAASSGAIKTLVVDPRHIGGEVAGFFGVLHTWGRTLQYHPHLHYVVVGGALSSADGRWHPARPGFYLPVRALARIVRAKFRDRIDARGLLGEIPAEVWALEWNVNPLSPPPPARPGPRPPPPRRARPPRAQDRLA